MQDMHDYEHVASTGPITVTLNILIHVQCYGCI